MNKFFSIICLFSAFFLAKAKDSVQIKKIIEYNKIRLEDCDACGCSIGTASSGFESILNPQFIGIKFLNQKYSSKRNAHLSQYTPEYYNTIQLWGRIPLMKNIDLYASLPYHFHKRLTEPQQKISGIGDLSLIGIYKVNIDKNKTQKLNLGLGVKVPIAKFDKTLTDIYNPSFQLGTGSWDFSGVINYTYHTQQWAFSVSSDYTFKNRNKFYYRFGDQWNNSLTGYYIHQFKDMTISPHLGFASEKYFKNVVYGEIDNHTGGNLIMSKIGLEISFRQFNIGIESQIPLSSNLSEGATKINHRNSIYLNYKL